MAPGVARSLASKGDFDRIGKIDSQACVAALDGTSMSVKNDPGVLFDGNGEDKDCPAPPELDRSAQGLASRPPGGRRAIHSLPCFPNDERALAQRGSPCAGLER